MAEYDRHEPEKALLHQVVREQLEGFLASAAHREQPTPRFVEQELRAWAARDGSEAGYTAGEAFALVSLT